MLAEREKKIDSIRFLHSIGILSESEMQDIIGYFYGEPLHSSENLDNRLVDDFEGLSQRTRNVLKKANVYTIGELKKFRQNEIEIMINLGKSGQKEIIGFLTEFQLKE